MTVSDELQARALFEQRYGVAAAPVARQLERRVIGGDWGANGYTTMAQADTLASRLGLSAADRLLDIGTGRGWPGLYLAARSGCRVVQRGWLLAEVAAELVAHRVTVRRLLDRSGIRRVRRTHAERAASESGRSVQAVSWQARRAARLAELGFEDLAAYLRARHGEQGWSVTRMRAELGVGRRWLVGELARLGLRP